MKTLLFVAVLSATTFAQDQAAITAAQSACGPKDKQFDVKVETGPQASPQVSGDKALVFVVKDVGQLRCWGCTTKVAVDGAWVGATKGNSYLSFSVEPGEHHLCAHAGAVALANFTAEAGKVYYFRARTFHGAAGSYSFDLDSINNDQGKLLVASSPLGVSQVKK